MVISYGFLQCSLWLFLEVSHSRRDWIERKAWKSVWRQGTSGGDDLSNQDTSNVWNQQQPSHRQGAWNRDDNVAGGDWNTNNFGGGWNSNNAGNTWNTNSLVNRWNSNNVGGGWNANVGGDWNGNTGNRWGSVGGGVSWNNGGESNEQIAPVRPSSFRKEFRRVETVKIHQQSKCSFRKSNRLNISLFLFR